MKQLYAFFAGTSSALLLGFLGALVVFGPQPGLMGEACNGDVLGDLAGVRVAAYGGQATLVGPLEGLYGQGVLTGHRPGAPTLDERLPAFADGRHDRSAPLHRGNDLYGCD